MALEDYIEVSERLAAFFDRYPEGSLQTDSWEVETIGDRQFVVYAALAFRTPNDLRPGMGKAWEPFPGPTPFTKDSELMNAETSAWGRACVAVGVTASKRIASREEVQARGGDPAPDAVAPGAREPNPHQQRLLSLLSAAKAQGMKLPALQEALNTMGLQEIVLGPGWTDQLTDEQAKDLGAWLELGLDPVAAP